MSRSVLRHLWLLSVLLPADLSAAQTAAHCELSVAGRESQPELLLEGEQQRLAKLLSAMIQVIPSGALAIEATRSVLAAWHPGQVSESVLHEGFVVEYRGGSHAELGFLESTRFRIESGEWTMHVDVREWTLLQEFTSHEVAAPAGPRLGFTLSVRNRGEDPQLYRRSDLVELAGELLSVIETLQGGQRFTVAGLEDLSRRYPDLEVLAQGVKYKAVIKPPLQCIECCYYMLLRIEVGTLSVDLGMSEAFFL